MINIGTKENPIMVPEDAIRSQEDAEQDFWEGVASGSVILDEEELNKLIIKDEE